MKRERSGIHNFHFMMDSDMKNELMDLDLYSQAGSLSGLIVNIFTMLISGLDNEYFFGKQRHSRYEVVTDDPNCEREHIHVYMAYELYRQLKLLHQDLNFYSIAQLMRFFLRLFLDVVREYGDNYQEEIVKLLIGWENKNNEKLFSHESLIQLFKFVHENVKIIKLLSIYSPQFTTFKKYRL